MSYELYQHIMTFEKAIPDEVCNDIVAHYNILKESNLTLSRRQMQDGTELTKKDETGFALEPEAMRLSSNQKFLHPFLDEFWNLYNIYQDAHPQLKNQYEVYCRFMRIQETHPGGGYHIWHHESDTPDHMNRICAWGLYLNDVEGGGETEFLHQHVRIPAVKGTLVIWPAGFTHPHRGNPPLSNTKYLLTGWTEF